MGLQGINHVVLKVKNLRSADYFYREILGMQLVGKRGGMYFYHAGGHPHDLALFEVGTNAGSPQRHQTGYTRSNARSSLVRGDASPIQLEGRHTGNN